MIRMPLIILAVLWLCWLIPTHIPPWWMIHTELPAFAASALCALSCMRWNASVIRIPNAIIWLVALLGTVILQRLLGQIVFAGDAWVAAAYIILFASAWLWGYRWTKQSGLSSVLIAIAYFLLAIGLITSFQIFAQWLKIETAFDSWILPHIDGGAPRGNIGQPNQAATTVMLAVVAIGLLYARKSISLFIASALGLLFVPGVLLTQSRTPLVSGVVLMVVLICSQAKTKSSRRLAIAVIFLCLVGMLGIYLWSVNRTSISTAGLVLVEPRILIWQQLAAAIWAHPWAGWGWLQVASAQQFGAIQFPGTVPVNYSHNIILDALVMLGVPIASMGFFTGFLWIKARWTRLSQSTDAIWAGVLTIPFWIHSLLELPHAYAYFLFPVAILFGAIDAGTEGKTTHVLSLPFRWFACLSIIWIALILAMGHEYLEIEEDFRVSRFESRGIGLSNSHHKKQDVLFFTQLEELALAAQIQIASKMKVDEIEALKRVAIRYTSSPLELRAAMALDLNGRPDEATERMQVIKNLFAADIYLDARKELSAFQKIKDIQ